MIMIGVRCEGCGKEVLDSGDKCCHCDRPYGTFILNMLASYQKAKEAMLDKIRTAGSSAQTKAEIESGVRRLGQASTIIAGFHERTPEGLPAAEIDEVFTTLAR